MVEAGSEVKDQGEPYPVNESLLLCSNAVSCLNVMLWSLI